MPARVPRKKKPIKLRTPRKPHQQTKRHASGPNKLPMSGSEPLYSELEYGTRAGKDNNNCYGYAIGSYRVAGGIKLQPGNLSRQTSNRDASSCPFLNDRVMDDNRRRGIYRVPAGKRCRKGYYKIMSFIDPGNDYHWYAQHGSLLYHVLPGETRATIARKFRVPLKSVVTPKTEVRPGDMVYVRKAGVFGHKQGFATGPLLVDASNKVIPDPRKANRNYGAYNYKKHCGTYCISDIPGAMSSQPSRPEARALQSLLNKNVRLLNSERKQPGQLLGRSAKVQRNNANKLQVQNIRP